MSASEEKHVDPVAAEPVAAPAAPAAAAPAPAAAAPAPAAAAPAPAPAPVSSEAFLAKLLDTGKTADPRWVQQRCLRTPSLMQALTPAARFKLYVAMLLGEEGSLRPLPEKATLAKVAAKATILQKDVAKQLHAQLAADSTITEEQCQGFAHVLNVATGFYFDADHVDVMLVMTRVLAKSGHFDKSAAGDAQLLEYLFNLLDVVNGDYLVSNTSRLYEKATEALLRLILQYHDPELSVHLDRAQVDMGSNVLSWVRRLGVLEADSDMVLPFWDWLFVVSDPTLVPYVIVAYLIGTRQQALASASKDAMQSWLEKITFAVPTGKNDVLDPKLVDGRAVAPLPITNGKVLMQSAELLVRNTPSSARRVLEFTLCPDAAAINKTPEALASYYAGAVVLPLERMDIAQSFARQAPAPQNAASAAAQEKPARRPSRTIEYIIADCRSMDSYEYAHLPTSIFLGDAVSYDTTLLSAATTRLESSKGAHVTVFGTGRPIQDEKNLLNVVALHLVQQKFPYVSYTFGGFRTVIPLIRANAIEVVMTDEDRRTVATSGPQSLASNAAASLTQAFSGLSHLWEGEAAQQRAGEAKAAANDLAAKAKVGFSSASAWGASMWRQAQEKLSEMNAPDASAAATGTAPTSAAPRPAASTKAPAAAPPAAAAASAKKATTAVPAAPQVFTLDDGHGEEEDDFGLITSMPAKPMEGAAQASKDAKAAEAAADAKPATEPTGAAASAATALTADINAEFDELFSSK